MNLQRILPTLGPASPDRPQPDRHQTDPLQLVATFRRRLRVFGATVALVLAGVIVFTLEQTPRYTATSYVMIDTRKRDVAKIDEVLSGLPSDSSAVDTEVEILKSRSLAGRVVQDLHLDKDPEFNTSLAKTSMLHSIMSAPAALLKSAAPAGGPQSAADQKAIADKKINERVVDGVLKRLKISRQGLTYVIAIDFTSTSQTKAADVANAYASDYLLEQLEAKFDATKQASQWLNDRLGQLRIQVEQAEGAVAAYRAQTGLMSAVGSNLTEQEVSNLNQQLALAQADQAQQDAKVRTARQQLAAGSNGEDVGAALDSDVVKQLRNQYAEVSGKLADLQTRYGARHPEVQRVSKQLDDIKGQIQLEINRTISNLDAQAQVSRQRASSIQASLGRARGTLAGNNVAAVRLNELERNATSVRTLYESFLNRFKETTTQQGMQDSDARVVSKAKIPNDPSFPKMGLNLIMGLVFGILAGFGAIILAEALDSGLATSDDIETYLGVASLGSVPLLSSTQAGTKGGTQSPAEMIVEKPLSAFAEAFRNLRTSIVYSRVDKPVRVIAVTSSLPGEGKTTTAFCLGRAMAMSGSRTVVVDCDVRRRNINRLLGQEPAVGLMEVLAGKATLDQALVLDSASGAWFLPLARSSFTPKDLFGGAAMHQLLTELKHRFEFVLLDTAPVLPVADTRSLAPQADVVVFLTQWRRTPRRAVQTAFELLRSVGADIAGVALTQVDVREQARYGYGDAGYYYRAYRKYYVQ
ncbi:MAG: polysaccharide biosynthesis tyrosine autokinase [Caulobacteraceae bacterium]